MKLIDNFASQKAQKRNFRSKYHNFNYFINLKKDLIFLFVLGLLKL